MKLQDLSEARYAFPDYVQEIHRVINSGKEDRRKIRLPADSHQKVLDDISKDLGPPTHENEFEGMHTSRVWQLWDPADQRWNVELINHPRVTLLTIRQT